MRDEQPGPPMERPAVDREGPAPPGGRPFLIGALAQRVDERSPCGHAHTKRRAVLVLRVPYFNVAVNTPRLDAGSLVSTAGALVPALRQCHDLPLILSHLLDEVPREGRRESGLTQGIE